MKKVSHHRLGDPEHNNPLANRFNDSTPKKPGQYARIAYVLQGGGALGAYQTGTIKALLDNGYAPDWISATSIGAIQAAIIVGNPPEQRCAKLDEFWRRIATYSAFDFLGEHELTLNFYNQMSANTSLLVGQRGFYNPRWCHPDLSGSKELGELSYYDTAPLKQTLLELIDFDLLNSSPIRLSLGAVQVSSGDLIYFNNINYRLEVDHIMASAALPPAFPAVKINDEYYWDGGVHSNTPLEVILDAVPAADTLCFVIDCFGGQPFIPQDMEGVAERSKEISYSTHAKRAIKHYVDRHRLQLKLQKVSECLTKAQRTACAELLDVETPHHCTIAHIAYSKRFHQAVCKDYNFGQVALKLRMEAGQDDIQAMLTEKDQWSTLPADGKGRLYEAPNNLSRLLRIQNYQAYKKPYK